MKCWKKEKKKPWAMSHAPMQWHGPTQAHTVDMPQGQCRKVKVNVVLLPQHQRPPPLLRKARARSRLYVHNTYFRIYVYLYMCMYIWMLGECERQSECLVNVEGCKVLCRLFVLHCFERRGLCFVYRVNRYVRTYVYWCIYLYIHIYVYTCMRQNVLRT